jgi:3-hydroxyisobutyrate dehydrogenase
MTASASASATGQPKSPGSPTVAVLGLGTMGHAMALNSLRAGLPTIVWNRSPGPAGDLAVLGAGTAATARDAVARAELVVTMVTDLGAVLDLALEQGMLDAMAPGAIWLQMSTIGLGIDRVARIVAERRPDVTLVDAPVSGSTGPAEAGTLTIFTSGPDEAITTAAPFFDAVGRRSVRVGPTGQGSRIKLVNNTMLALTAEGVAASIALAHRLGLMDETLLDALDDSPLLSQWAAAKLRRMSNDDYRAEFALVLALKDVDLALDTLDADRFMVLRSLAREWHEAAADGFGSDDVTVVARFLESQAHHASV